MIGKLYKIILDFIRSIDFLTQLIWKIKVQKKLLPITYDLTSLVLKKTIVKYNNNYFFNSHLDMGCGQIAILGQFHKKINSSISITSADIYDEFLDNAKKNSDLNKLEITFIQTNMFSNIKDKYDLITFNPPYVPLRFKFKEIKFDKISYSGEKGTNAIELFLDSAGNFLTEKGVIFLGVNLFYVPLDDLNELISNYKYKIIENVKMSPNKCIVLVLRK
tara:strand:+ start:867 stop:1523 length:657 start_codon:yes stop_codon:yes gene_type:complete